MACGQLNFNEAEIVSRKTAQRLEHFQFLKWQTFRMPDVIALDESSGGE